MYIYEGKRPGAILIMAYFSALINQATRDRTEKGYI